MIVVISLLITTPAYGSGHSTVPRFAYVANEQDDTVSIFAIRGYRLRAVGYVYTGAGSNPRSVVVTPTQSVLYVALGDVGIAGYAINNVTGELTGVPGSPFLTGPEVSLAMHPGGHFLVAFTGISMTIYSISPSTGSLTSIQTLTGGSPISGAIDPTGAFLFSANVKSNSVSAFLINQSTGTLTAVPGSPFPSGPSPQSVAIQHGKFLYVPNGGGASISAYAINAVTGVLTQLSGSPFPAGFVPIAAATKNSFLFVGNSADHTVTQYAIDPTNGILTQLATPFSTGNSAPLGLAASPTEPLLYVADHDLDEVIVHGITKNGVLFNESSIRSRGNAISIALASGNAPVTFLPRFVYECNQATNDIWGYAIENGTGSLKMLENSPTPIGISPQAVVSDLGGRFLFTANTGSNNVSGFTVNSQTGAILPSPGSPFPAGAHPSAIAVDNGAHFAYVPNSDSNSISSYSIESNGSLMSILGSPFMDRGVGPQAIAIDSRGKYLYVANAKSNTVSMFVIDARTGVLQQGPSASTGIGPSAAAINPDGKYLYVLNRISASISAYAIDSVTGRLVELAGSPFAGTVLSDSIATDPMGERLYEGGDDAIVGFRLFDNRGNLKLLPQSPFNGVSGAYGMSLDFSDDFLYATNSSSDTISGFQVDRKTGGLLPLTNSPYLAGGRPTSITLVNSFQ